MRSPTIDEIVAERRRLSRIRAAARVAEILLFPLLRRDSPRRDDPVPPGPRHGRAEALRHRRRP